MEPEIEPLGRAAIARVSASLVWGSIGVGYCIYGRKQRSVVPFVGGVALIAVSYLVDSVLLMSLVGLGLLTLVYALVKRGY